MPTLPRPTGASTPPATATEEEPLEDEVIVEEESAAGDPVETEEPPAEEPEPEEEEVETSESDPSELPTASQVKVGEPVKIRVESLILPAELEKTKYWIGTTDDSPLQNAVVGGISFPAFTGTLSHDKRLLPIRPNTKGAVVELSDQEVAHIVKRLEVLCIRRIGSASAYLVSRTQRNFTPRVGDVPLAKFVFMIKLGDTPPSYDWRKNVPENMLHGG